MTNEEAIAYFKERNEIIVVGAKDENMYDYEKQVIEADCMRETFEANEKAIQALEQTRWISVNEIGYPKPEDEYKHFITIDNKGEITIQEFLLSLDEEPQPYFSGMRNIVAYINMPLPEPYNVESEDKE